MTKSHHAVLLPALLLEHDDPVRTLVKGRRQSVSLRVQRLDPPLQIKLALRHYCDLIPVQERDGDERGMIRGGMGAKDSPESLEMGDVLSHARLLVVHLVPHRLQLAREGFLNFGALQRKSGSFFNFPCY